MRMSHGRTVILIAISALLLLVWTFPVLWGVVTSLKTERDVLAYPPTMIFEPTWRNYLDALIGRDSIIPNLWSSLIIATSTTVLTIGLAVPAAYAFARLRLRSPAGCEAFRAGSSGVSADFPVDFLLPLDASVMRVLSRRVRSLPRRVDPRSELDGRRPTRSNLRFPEGCRRWDRDP